MVRESPHAIILTVKLLFVPVWALYPESNQRTLEEMDLLFAANKPWVWTAESNFKVLKAEHPELGGASKPNRRADSGEGVKDLTVHAETV